MNKNKFSLIILLIIFSLCIPGVYAQEFTIPGIELGLTNATEPEDVAMSLQIVFLLTILTLAPGILILMTSFTRVVIVLSFVRQGLATQQMPPNQVIIGLALFITFFVMSPVFSEVNTNAIQPYMNEEISQGEALDNALSPVREFMFKYTREADLAMFISASDTIRPETKDDVPLYVLVPAFVISEIKTAFQIGFLIFIPFLVIDMIVASVLMSMGMMMLPPMMISLPFKILLFVLVDGWHMVVRSLITGF
ncbi:MAG: flagellar type III secretion system pore protein FliP [Eubacteriales bacterium]|jgi:flagellar biosynthetic protein FliP|nr:flagellar type III secretion system pore protein FliP [Eubacteriales bacterium]NCC80692.1 flagellar biosynthetic protein FliP [Clostridia bacterium]